MSDCAYGCVAEPLHRVVLISPDGRERPPSVPLCSEHLASVESRLIPQYGDGTPAYRVEAMAQGGAS